MSAAPRRAILADGAPPAALAAARSLVRAGWRVEATRAAASDRAPASRGVVPLPAPSPARDPEGFAAALLRAAREGARPVLLPCTDAALLAVEARRGALEAAADLPLPPAPVLRGALDKGLTLEAARRAGVSIPDTFTVRSAGDVPRCPVRPPMVAKPLASRWASPAGTVGGAGPSFCDGLPALREAAGRLLAAGAPGVLVQPFVPGTGRGVALLLRGGAPAAVFVHRRLREVHPAGGPSSAAVSEPPDPALVAPAVALLREMGWEGLAMVEFRREGTAPPVLMEVNPRPWGTLGLAVDAGVDFPRLLLEGYRGPPPAYTPGVERRWLAGDLRRLLAAAKGPPPGYPGPFPRTSAALRDVALGWRTDFVFRWEDPLPFGAEVLGGVLR